MWTIVAEDWHRRRPARASATTMARIAGGVVALLVALGVLYVAFRGSPGRPAAQTATLGPSGVQVGSMTGAGTRGSGTAGPAAGVATSAVPPASARPAGSPRASALGAAMRSYLAGRSGTVRLAVYDLATAQSWSLGDGAAQAEASVVKVNVLEALLSQRPSGLTSYDQSLAQQMIEDSSNDAATSLWNLVGGSAGVAAYNQRAGLTQTTPSACVACAGFPWPGWGLTTTTPEDQITLLRRLVQPGGTLTGAQRDYALSLMENVTPDQQWGVSGGVPAGTTVALKNGWLPLDAASSDWQINSVGWVHGGGRDYLLAMLSTGNPSEQYGIDTLNALGAMAWQAL